MTNGVICQNILNYSAGPFTPLAVDLWVCWGLHRFSYPPVPWPSISFHHLLCFHSAVEAKKRVRKELCEKDSECLFMRMLALRWHAFFPPSHEAVKWNRYSEHYVIKCNPDPAFWSGTTVFPLDSYGWASSTQDKNTGVDFISNGWTGQVNMSWRKGHCLVSMETGGKRCLTSCRVLTAAL